jgi:tetrapyrrole methylase family protein/MazG family protein
VSPSTPFADPAVLALLARAGVDLGEGLQVVALDRLAARPFDPGVALLVLPPRSAPLAQDAAGADPYSAPHPASALPGRHGHGVDPLALLRRLYPAEHPLLGTSSDLTLATADPASLAAEPHILPPLAAELNVAGPFALAWLVDRLRQPDGCPWDREQDHLTLRPFLLEETYEVYDALEAGSTPELAEELGDLLLQIVLHAQYGAEAGVFDLADVQRAVTTKIIRRHPHVFGDVDARTAGEVMRNWEQLKAAERAEAGRSAPDAPAPARRDVDMPAAFAGLSTSLPALAYADEMQGRAASLGYDWPDLEGVIDKIAEEATELLAATDGKERREEFGDLLFVMVNLGRKLGIDAEAALRSASRKFASRFARVERLADEQGLQLRALGLDALDELWQEAKREEAAGQAAGRAEEGR